MKRILPLWIAFWFGVPAIIAEPLSPDDIRVCLSKVPAAELPSAASGLIKQALIKDRASTTTNVVRIAVAMNPAAAPLIVGAVAGAVPESAPLAAACAAVQELPQLEDITRAAVGVAPTQVRETVTALCIVAPSRYRDVALVAARLLPTARTDILAAVGAARPDLKPFIERQIPAHGQSLPSVGYCLHQAELARARATGSPSLTNPTDPPQAGQPTPDAAGSKPPHGNGHPPGGRNYARP